MAIIVKNLYECILTRFGCPLTIIIDQGVHIINDAFKYLIDHFLLKHVSSTTYYLQGNGQVESTNKVLGTLLTKLVNENRTNQDEHLSIVLFTYGFVYKVATRYTPYQLMYGLHPLMPTQYIMLIVGGNERNNASVKVLTNKIIEWEKLQEDRMQATETTCIQQWNRALWSQQMNLEKQFNFGDYVLWFPKGNKSHLGKFTKKKFGPYKIQYVLLNNIVLLVTIEKFETNLVLVNMNKLRPHKYMEFEVQKQKQHMLMYQEQNIGGFQAENFDTEVEDEDYDIQKPQIWNNKDDEQMEYLAINIILIVELHMTNES